MTEVQIQSRQYLTFRLADEQYGLEVLQVREVLEVPKITRVPRMPDFMKGVINIRGSVVPVIDLRLKLGLTELERSVNSRVVIIEMASTQETLALGILVDSVQEVIEIQEKDISPAPHIGTGIDASFITGIAKLGAGFVIVINIGRVFASEEIKGLQFTEQDKSVLEATAAASA